MTERVDVEGLLPCPFCGGDGKLYDNEWVRNVICQDCGASTFDTEQSLESARDEWNRRASPPSLLAEVAALRAENERMQRALESRDLICEALQRELGPERTLRALGLDPARVAQSRREIAKGKTVSLDELRAALAAQEPR